MPETAKPRPPFRLARVEITRQAQLAVYGTVVLEDADGKQWQGPWGFLLFNLGPVHTGDTPPSPAGESCPKEAP